MSPSTQKHKTTRGIILPDVPEPVPRQIQLPYGGVLRTRDHLAFSFVCFDREHRLFNLGGSGAEAVEAGWFIDLLDCLKMVSQKKITELGQSMYDLHPVDWKHANASMPEHAEQCEFWQFRINKSKGRIIGILIDGIFYVTWLDPHHNLSDSAGYRGAAYYRPAKSQYEILCERLEGLEAENKNLKADYDAACRLLEERMSD